MQKWYSTRFHLSPPNRRKISLRKGPWIFRNRRKAPISISLSRLALFRPPPAVRRPGSPSAPPGCLLAPPHAPTRPRHLPAPPQHPWPAQRRCLLRPLAVESPRAKSTAPRHHIPRPGTPRSIRTPRAPPSRPFSSFFLLPPLRHGRRDPARADRLTQPYIVPSDPRSSFATS